MFTNQSSNQYSGTFIFHDIINQPDEMLGVKVRTYESACYFLQKLQKLTMVKAQQKGEVTEKSSRKRWGTQGLINKKKTPH